MSMIDTTNTEPGWDDKHHVMNPKEVTEMHGVLFSGKSVDLKDDIGPDGICYKNR